MSLPAPTGGWDAISSLDNMPPDRAIVLDNWFPRPDSVQVRRGIQLHNRVGSGAIETLIAYHGVTSLDDRLFCPADGSIWQITFQGNTQAHAGGFNNFDRWQWINFTTPAAKFLWMCNGVDDPLMYDGSFPFQIPVITGITASDIVNVNAHQSRLWFVIKDSTTAAYLATDAIQGAATTFELGDLFTLGGYLVAMATWTRDGGSGPDDLAVFISSRGQCAIYSGTDPASTATWSLVGVFNVGAPLGRRCFTKSGGDVALICIDGVLPLSRAIQAGQEAETRFALTRNIQNAMNTAARSYKDNFGWQLQNYPQGTMVLLNVPVVEGDTQHQYVMNTVTGAWCRFTGWNVNCMTVFQDNLYLGGNDGSIYLADTSAYDLTTAISADGQCAYNYYKSRGILKNFSFVRGLITTNSEARLAVGMSTDFLDNASLGTPSSSGIPGAVFDSAIFDTDIFDTESISVSDWASVAVQGHSGSIHFRAVTGATTSNIWGTAVWSSGTWGDVPTGDINLRVSAFDVIYKTGGYM
jgi:hypothetical protein